MTHDLLLRGGTVVDGSGGSPYRADVAVDGGRISAIGRLHEPARTVVEAEGHVVTPGFVDGHTHMDAQVFWDPLGASSCWHGVTSVVTGNCGFTLAPVRSGETDLVVSNLERAEDIPAAALREGIIWSWESFPEYLDAVERQPKAVNYAAQIGHSALRTWAMGERAFTDSAGEADLATMTGALREAMRAGAAGFTTSRSDHHRRSDDRPVASRLATWEEVVRLAGVLGEEQRGVFELATDTDVTDSPDVSAAQALYAELAELAVMGRVPVTFGMRVRHVAEQLAWLESVRDAGGELVGQTRCEGFSQVFSFRSSMPFDDLVAWREVRQLPLPSQLERLRGTGREPLAAAVRAAYGRAGGYDASSGLVALPPLDSLEVPTTPGVRARTVTEIAEERRRDPVEVLLDLAVESQFAQVFVRYMEWEQDDLLAVLRHPLTVMTFSDAGAHVSRILSSSIQSRLFSEWVRERGVFRLEEAVRMLTAVPAHFWRLPDRGLVREGLVADLNVFDPERIAPGVPTIEHDLPGGVPRVDQRAVGILATVVGGEVTLREGEPTGALPGRLLRPGRR